MEKRCASCKQVKDAEEFIKNKRRLDGLYPYCRDCHAERGRARYEKHRDRILAAQNGRQDNPVDIWYQEKLKRVREELKAAPHMANKVIAERAGSTTVCVIKEREHLESVGEIEIQHKLQDRTGKWRRRHFQKIRESTRFGYQPLVYFIQQESPGGHIKIGYASTLDHRFATLQVSSPYQNKLLAVLPGTRIHEKAIHDRYKDCHVRGDWFLPSPELMRFIQATLEQNPLESFDKNKLYEQKFQEDRERERGPKGRPGRKAKQRREDGQKHCYACDTFQSPESYRVFSKNKDGLDDMCRGCRRRKERHPLPGL